MRIKTKFVLDRAGFRNQVLKDFGDSGVVDAIMPAVKAAAPTGTTVETSTSKSRVRIRIVDDRPGAGHREAETGALSRALNGLRI